MPQISFEASDDLSNQVNALANNFGGNLSEAMRILLTNIFENSSSIIINDDKLDEPTALSKLVEKGSIHYSFKDKRLTCYRKLGAFFIKYFNAIDDVKLKENLFEFIVSLVGYLYRRDSINDKGDKNNKPWLNGVDNLSIYDKEGYHVLYISVNNYLKYKKIIISKLIQCRINKFQPDIPYIWNIITETLEKNPDDKNLVVSADELNILAAKFADL